MLRFLVSLWSYGFLPLLDWFFKLMLFGMFLKSFLFKFRSEWKWVQLMTTGRRRVSFIDSCNIVQLVQIANAVQHTQPLARPIICTIIWSQKAIERGVTMMKYFKLFTPKCRKFQKNMNHLFPQRCRSRKHYKCLRNDIYGDNRCWERLWNGHWYLLHTSTVATPEKTNCELLI